MPFAYERSYSVALTPMLHRQKLVALIAPVEKCECAAIAWQRLRASDNLDVRTPIAPKEYSASFDGIFGRSRISLNRFDDVVRNIDETQARSEDHAALGPHAGHVGEGNIVVSFTMKHCAGSKTRVRNLWPALPRFHERINSSASAAADIERDTGNGA